ncbi:DUF3040 domain-containing protein [Arthrobacter sp. MDT2-2]
MALSAQERRQWNELERQLVAGSPQAGQLIEGSGLVRYVARTTGAVLTLAVVLVAFMIVVLAVIVKVLLVGVLGFVLMIIGGTEFRFPGSAERPAGVLGRTAQRTL